MPGFQGDLAHRPECRLGGQNQGYRKLSPRLTAAPRPIELT